jgi:hypothetical protein
LLDCPLGVVKHGVTGEKDIAMKKTLRGNFGWIAFAILALVTSGVGVAYAAGTISPSSNNTYNGCVNNTTKALRIASTCNSNESSITLSGPQGTQTKKVDCNTGGSIQSAINNAPANLPLIVKITGVCTEAVSIVRNQVTLTDGATGAGITAPSSSQNPISLFGAAQVNINSLTLSGGAAGIEVSGPGTTGPSSALIEGVTINHATVGVSVDYPGASAAVWDSTINNSSQSGVVVDAGSVNVGGKGTGTMITGSTFDGIDVSAGGTAQVTGSAKVESSGRFGILVFDGGNAEIQGSLVENNSGPGLYVQGATARVDGGTLTNNGSGAVVTGGGRLDVTFGTSIQTNGGDGITVSGGSVVSLTGDASTVIGNNGGDGIHLHDSSVAYLNGTSHVTNNNGWGIFCESSPADAMTSGSSGTVVTGNTAGQNNCVFGP